MWYQVDFNKLMVQMIPSFLRRNFLVNLLKVIITPVVYLYNLWTTYREESWRKLYVTPQVGNLEHFINEQMNTTEITITSLDLVKAPGLFFESENGSRTVLYKSTETSSPYYIGGEYYVPEGYTIKVVVPKTIYDVASDMRKLKSLMNTYKAAGRTCKYVVKEL